MQGHERTMLDIPGFSVFWISLTSPSTVALGDIHSWCQQTFSNVPIESGRRNIA